MLINKSSLFSRNAFKEETFFCCCCFSRIDLKGHKWKLGHRLKPSLPSMFTNKHKHIPCFIFLFVLFCVCVRVCLFLFVCFHLVYFFSPSHQRICISASGAYSSSNSICPHGELYRFLSAASGSAVYCVSCFLFPVFSSFLSGFKLNKDKSTS